jgi:hypothetical protein
MAARPLSIAMGLLTVVAEAEIALLIGFSPLRQNQMAPLSWALHTVHPRHAKIIHLCFAVVGRGQTSRVR